MKPASVIGVAALVLGVLGCAGRQPVETVRIPPRIDLKQHEMIGVVQFDSTPRGELAPLVTRRFTEWARRDQGLVRMLEFDSRTDVLQSVGRDRWDSTALKAIREELGIETILAGEVMVSNVRPDIRISAAMRSGRVTAQVDATLEVQLIETATGASIWSSSASATQTVGHVSVFRGGGFAFDADDPEKAYGGLVDALVEQATRDFRARWVRR